MLETLLPWAIFLIFVAGLLALDLGVFHRHAHAVTRKESLIWSVAWIGMALIFNAGIYVVSGTEKGLEWTAGYLIEKSLSVDNVFIFLIIFSTFKVPAQYQHRVLFWGIVGAIVMRAVLIALGAALLTAIHAVIYLFGAFLVFTGLRFLRQNDHGPDLENNRLLRIARRFMPSTEGYEGQEFFVVRNGVRYMTPLFLVLLLIEGTDLIFALDSIPAIFAITDDPFVVFTSNIFAILGLRSLYFVLSGYLTDLRYLKPGLAAVLIFVGVKMILTDIYHIPAFASLAVIVAILGTAIAASVIVDRRGSTYVPGELPPEEAERLAERASVPDADGKS